MNLKSEKTESSIHILYFNVILQAKKSVWYTSENKDSESRVAKA